MRFKENIEIRKAKYQAACDWLNDKPPHQWSKSHFSTYPKCDIVCNNLCESFNNLIKKARGQPILTMLEDIRDILMTRIVKNRGLMKKWWGYITPNALDRLEKGKERAEECLVRPSSDTKFQI